jgi:membrane protein
MKRLKRKLLFSRAHRTLIRWTKRIVPPGFEGFSLYAIGRFFLQALDEGQVETRASAISFKVFVAFFPAVIVVLTLIPYIPIPDAQERMLATFKEQMPAEVFGFIEGQLHDLLVRKHGTLLSVSFLIGLYAASNSIMAFLLGFSGSSNLSTRHSPLKQRLLSLALLLILTILLVIAVPLLTLSNTVIRWLEARDIIFGDLEKFGLYAAKWGISTLLLLVIIGLLYRAGDPHAKRFKLFSPGALLALLLTLLISQGLAFFFEYVTDYNALYGSIGTILAVLFWIHLNVVALLVGFELNTSIGRARRQHSSELRIRP